MEPRAKKFAGLIFHPIVAQFIDKNRLIKSPEFEDLINEAASHAATTRDTTIAMRIAQMYESSKHFKAIKMFLEERAQLAFEVDGGTVHIRPGPQTSHLNEFPFAPYLRKGEGSIYDVFGPAKHMAANAKVDAGKDAMSAGMKVDGSFGSGKRR